MTELTSCKVWEPRGKLWDVDIDSRVIFNIRHANLIRMCCDDVDTFNQDHNSVIKLRIL